MQSENDEIDDSNIKQIPVSGGFTVPATYFQFSRTSILAQTTKSGSPSDFGVPDSYFEDSRKKIITQTIGKVEVAKTPLKLWYQKTLFKYAATAMVIFSVTLMFTLRTSQTNTTMQGVTTNELSDEEIISYLENNNMKDIPATEVSFALPAVSSDEHDMVNQTDEQLMIEEL